MRGQWLGAYSGTNSGFVTVDIDEVGNRFWGYAYLWDNDPALPHTRADINVAKPAANNLVARLPLLPIDRITGEVSSWPVIARKYPVGTQFPSYAASSAARSCIMSVMVI
jgi:hypothetical protein